MMFEVVTFLNGKPLDHAEADSAEASIVAARTLLQDARDHGAGHPTVSLYSDGFLYREGLTLANLDNA